MDNNQTEQSQKTQSSKRYKGYDVEKITAKVAKKKKTWFWQVLGISLLISLIIILGFCAMQIKDKKKQTDYLSKINEANTLESILEDHSNATITQTFSHLKDKNDYKKTRFLKMKKSGAVYSYLKTEGLDEDYKEVLKSKKLYRYDGNYVYFYGLVGDDLDNIMKEITDDIYQTNNKEVIKEQTETSELVKAKVQYTTQEGDSYSMNYKIEPGSVIDIELIFEKESKIVTTVKESINGEEFYTYALTFNGDDKVPEFYRNTEKKTHFRKCIVYYNYKGDNEEKVEFTVPVDTYFTLLEHNGYRVFMEKDCLTEFNNSQMQLQNPYADLTLYMKKD